MASSRVSFTIGAFACLSILAGCDEPLASDEGGSTSNSASGAPTASSTGSGGEGGGGAVPADPCSPFVGSVVAVEYGEGAGFGQDKMPAIVQGPPKGGGEDHGSLDVLSLGNGGRITLAFGDRVIKNGPGPDFVVFENAFYAGGDPASPFAEIAGVEVSEDGTTWVPFPCTATESPWDACAGWHPVLANPDENQIDPLDFSAAGGDAFDLSAVGLEQARFVRITDRVDLVGDTPSFDLDAVALTNSICTSE